MVKITHSKIDVRQVIDSVSSPESGGTDVFIGTTRNHSGGRPVQSLTYEAYEPMAIKLMVGLEQEARARWPLTGIAMIHRLGAVDLREASVVIAVSAAHRGEAFDACRFLIDRLKRDVPIWKKEHFTDGSSEWSGASGQVSERAEAVR